MSSDRREHPKGCGCAVCVRRRERLEADPRERELAASEGDPEFEHSPGDHSEPGRDTHTVEEHHHHETERERTVEHHHHDQGKDGKDGKDGRDGKRGGDGSHGHRFARKNHHHPKRGLLRTLLVGALLLFVLHSFYPNLNIPLVPGIACAPGPITTTQTPAGTTPVSATGVEPVALGSDLGGLAQDTIGAVLKTIAIAAAEKVLHEVGDTVKAMLSHAPSPTDIRAGLAHDFELAGKAVGFVLAGLQGKPLGGGTNVSTTAAVPAGGCGAGSCAGSAVPAATGVNGIDTAARAALRAGWTGEAAVIAVAVAGPESAYQAAAKNRSSTARGMWQTMMSYHAPKYHGASWADPYANARVAHQIWADAGGWGPWVGYTSGAYRGFMTRARAAISRVQRTVNIAPVAFTFPTTKTTGLQPIAVQAENYVRRAFGFRGSIGGYATSGHITNSKHYQGLAIDVMVPLGAQADRITNYFAGPGYARWHVDNVIHNHRIFNAGRGWHAYPERGNPTLNHEDHVHIDFVSGAPVSAAVAGAAPAASCGGSSTAVAAAAR